MGAVAAASASSPRSSSRLTATTAYSTNTIPSAVTMARPMVRRGSRTSSPIVATRAYPAKAKNSRPADCSTPYQPSIPSGIATSRPCRSGASAHPRTSETLIAELIREAALEGVRDELPHSIAVVIDEILPRPDRPEDKPLTDIFASIVVERDSQKGIIIGHKGARLREIGAQAREQINRLLGTRVHLNLHVKVMKEWQRDAKYLNRLGF